jgi:hypothetical protein
MSETQEHSSDPNLLLEVIYGGYYSTVIPGQYLGDFSMYWQNRFVVHKNIPQPPNSRGGISFNPGANAFVAVNDSFLHGREQFEINFTFFVASDNPTSGTLCGSNWATPNDGDWLLQFNADGRLQFVQQSTKNTTIATSQRSSFLGDTEYRTRFVKNKETVVIYINDIQEIIAPCPNFWAENGVPLAFGGNAYDRIDGLDYFIGSIGGIKIYGKPVSL